MDNIFSVNTIIVIFIILFPGIIIRRAFYSNKFSKQFYRGQFSERLLTTLFWGIINLIIATILCFFILKVYFKPTCIFCDAQFWIYKILTFDFTKESLVIYEVPYNKLFLFLSLFIFNLFLLPFLIGRFAFVIIRKFKIDLKFSPLSFSNHWHYFFKGEIIRKIENVAINKNLINFRSKQNNLSVLDILTIEGDQKYLYKGILLDYNLKDDNEDLDSIVLYEPRKKKYDKDRDENGKLNYLQFEEIPGNFILIPYSSILNINVSIKPFDSQESKVNVLSEESSEKSLHTSKEDKVRGCLVFVFYLAFFLMVCKYAEGISYMRFTLGLLASGLVITLVYAAIESVIRKFTLSKFFVMMIVLFLSYGFLTWIFNFEIFNPIRDMSIFIKATLHGYIE
ncbi:hypothetical protein [Moheibacter sediminis]|uniref:Uncharacterized protein n=1 Tax=Moheibacter sediminis TaxID=1434700 RepID=A0A1W1YBM8_9FLAO|nr:hypothetical protein [Moheibacter sediminis]SMC33620.1 hypothetical protein SAMN06296427_101235 [Moheibacter sediminis]